MASIVDRWYTGNRGPDAAPTKQPTSRKDRGLRWRVYYRAPNGDQRSKSFARKVDAENFLIGVEGAKLNGSYIEPARSRLTVGVLAETWMTGKVNLKPTTRDRYQAALRVHVLPRWEKTPLDRIQHSAVQDWVASMASDGQSGASVRKNYGVLCGVLDRAVRDRRIPVNPARGVDLPPMNERRRRYLTAAEVAALAAAAARGTGDPLDGSYQQYRLVIFTLSYCGLRWGELAALKVDRVDLVRRRLDIAETITEVNGHIIWGTPKSHETRSVPIPTFLAEELANHLAGRAADDLVFTALMGGVLRNRAARRSWFNRAAAEIGRPTLVPHELRHTAASLAISAGGSVKAVQRMLGHASAAMTLDRYADLFDEDLDTLGEQLDMVARRAFSVAPALPRRECEAS